MKLSDYRGKTVLLEFFATWCPHCQAEARHLVQLSQTLASRGVAFLSVNADSEDAREPVCLRTVLRHHLARPAGSRFPRREASTRRAGAGPVTQAFGVALYPTFYIIDSLGRVAWRGDREQPDALLLQKLIDVSGA